MAVLVTRHNVIPTVETMNERPVLALLLLLVVALLSAACGSADSAGSPAEEDAPTPDPTAAPTSAPTAAPAQERLEWFVAALNAEAPPSVEEIEARFSPAFLTQVPYEQLLQGAAQMTAAVPPPLSIESVTPRLPDGTALEAVLVSADGTARLNVMLETAAEEPHLIEGLVGVPDAALEFPTELTVPQLDEMLANIGADSALGVYDVSDGECNALHEIRADNAVALGSTFKLWVLAELADRIAAGDASWDDTVLIEDRHKSSPDGEVFARPAGTDITLRELAMLMISISDNSATDHLIAYLGRERIEAVMERIGVSTAERNVPLLTTAALFQLKFVPDGPNSSQYRELDQQGRRALLEEIDAAVLPWLAGPESVEPVNAEGVPLRQPRDLDLEWFATPLDLCHTLTYLADQAATPGLEPVADILEANPGAGMPFDRDRWPTIRFKGGSEPGVLATAWWFEDADGRRIVVAGGVSNPDEPLDDVAASIALGSAITLVD